MTELFRKFFKVKHILAVFYIDILCLFFIFPISLLKGSKLKKFPFFSCFFFCSSGFFGVAEIYEKKKNGKIQIPSMNFS